VSSALLESCHKKWLDLNPDFTVVWYTNKDCDRFMEKFFSGKVNQTYKILKPGAYKADLWRLCMLYKFGGFYIDAYVEPYVSIRKMISGCNCPFISVLDSPVSGGGIHNGIIFSHRKHPFLLQAVQDIVKNTEERYYGNSPLDITGPIALSKSIKKLTENTEHCKGYNNTKYPYYLYELCYGPNQNVYDKDTKIASKYFSFAYYLYKKLSVPDRYTIAWKNRKVYASVEQLD
jgi:mannosyltransferase OCH1-like enzyme